MKRPWLIPVGGFLGAGKTTLILAAARVLAGRGWKCAAILNDQGGELVDSAYVKARGVAADEVTGGCFCCRFSEMLEAAGRLRAMEPEAIFLEPVGSCTDLGATILQPLRREFAGDYRLAPLTVVVDPACAADLGDEDVRFLFENQLAEADLVLFNKSDRHGMFPKLEVLEARYVSARTGDGVAAWLDEILQGAGAAGSGKVLEIDYERYARAEAALGWLNWTAEVRVRPGLSPAALVGPWMDGLQEALTAAGARIAHLKVFDQTRGGYLKVALTGNAGPPEVEGDLGASPETEHALRVNLRAVMEAAGLREVFLRSLGRLAGERREERMECFSPAAPRPERRVGGVGFVPVKGATSG